jgi:hypothetical protein
VELSADLLKSMLSGIKTEQGKGVAEMRQAPRVSVRYTVKVAPYNNGTLGQPIRVWTRDISSGGIGLLHNQRFEVGSRFIIQLPRERGKPLLLLCTVRNCDEISDHLYAVGASFAEVAGASSGSSNTAAAPRISAASPPATPAAKPMVHAAVVPAIAGAATAVHQAGGNPTASPADEVRLLTEEVERISRAILS